MIPVVTNPKTMEADTHEQYITSTPQTMSNSDQLSQIAQTGTQNKRAITDTSSQMSPPTNLSPKHISATSIKAKEAKNKIPVKLFNNY